MPADQPFMTSLAVHIWRVPLVVDGAAVADLGVLDDGERHRADGYADAAARRAFAVTRARLRQILGGLLGTAPQSLGFVTGPTGKPALAIDTGLEFNVAHAGEQALIATSRAGPVGIDIERDQDVPEREAIARLLFTPAERAVLAAAPLAQRRATFLRLWTCKEALLKAAGTGFRAPLAEGLGERWRVEAIDAPSGYVAALARPWGTMVIEQSAFRTAGAASGAGG